MKTYTIQDKYNDSKVWVIKVYCRGQVTFNQYLVNEVGIISPVNNTFTPTTKAWINEILDINLNDRLSDEEQQELLDSEPPAEYMGQDGALYSYEDIDYPYWDKQKKFDFIEDKQDDLDPLPF
jgi:hypothetical protein